MADTLSEHFGIDPSVFQQLGIFDAFLDIDTHLFIDPHLLQGTTIPEFKHSHESLKEHFRKIIKLLSLSKNENDLPWKEAKKRFRFRELKGVSIGYGKNSSDGSGVGNHYAGRLLARGKKLIELGIQDPEVFELIGLFEEGFGPDRLSDMTVSIIKNDLLKYTSRVTKELDLKPVVQYPIEGQTYPIPKHPRGKKLIIFLPKEFLRKLPIAHSWDDIGRIVAFNARLRGKLNQLMGTIMKESVTKAQKISLIKEHFLRNPETIKEFIAEYKKYPASPYDFAKDPKGELVWNPLAKQFAPLYPIAPFTLPEQPSIEDIEQVVQMIVYQFKELIELNGLNEHLYTKSNGVLKPRPERFAQLLFFAVSKLYCQALNIDVSRETNAGSGPVDFKYSKSYDLKYLVELKLSKHSNLVKGYSKQLTSYVESEKAKKAAYVIIKVTQSKDKINDVLGMEKDLKDKNQNPPKVFIVDGLIKPSASKRR